MRFNTLHHIHKMLQNCLGGTKVGEGSGDRLKSPAGPGLSPGKPPRKLLGFEYLGSFSVNNFEAFCECDEVY
jgi:hypothetical protein